MVKEIKKMRTRMEEKLYEACEDYTDDMDKILKSWLRFEREHIQNNHCICGYKLQHQFYYINKYNSRVICLGSGCEKHIRPEPYIWGKDKIRDRKVNYLSSNLIDIGDYDLDQWCALNAGYYGHLYSKYVTAETISDLDELLLEVNDFTQYNNDNDWLGLHHLIELKTTSIKLEEQKKIQEEQKKIQEEQDNDDIRVINAMYENTEEPKELDKLSQRILNEFNHLPNSSELYKKVYEKKIRIYNKKDQEQRLKTIIKNKEKKRQQEIEENRLKEQENRLKEQEKKIKEERLQFEKQKEQDELDFQEEVRQSNKIVNKLPTKINQYFNKL